MVAMPDAGETIFAGLCASCTHVQKVTAARGSQFLRCQASRWNPNLPKYPRLPVVRCLEYQPIAGTQPES
jgi:hypothetical protein